MFYKVTDEATKTGKGQITEIWRDRQWPISRPKFKNRLEITFNRFSSLEKKTTFFHFLKDKHGTMQLKALHIVGAVSCVGETF